MDDLLADFLTETSENIADLDVALLKLERTPDDQDTLSLIFRLVHTIKGTCGFLGLPRLEHVAHAAENVLGKVRDGVLTATPDTVTLVLAALDRIKAILGDLAATGSEVAGDDGELIAALNATAAGEAPKPAAPVVAAEPEPEAEPEEEPAPEQPVAPVAEAAPAPVAPRALVPSEPAAGRAGGNQPDHPRHRRRAGGPDDAGERAGAHPQPASPARPHAGEHRLRGAAAAAVAHHLGPAGRGDEDAHAADRQCLEQAAAPGPRPVPRNGQEDRAHHARRGHRAGPPGAGADQGSADAHGAQQRRPRTGERRRSGAPPANRKPATSR